MTTSKKEELWDRSLTLKGENLKWSNSKSFNIWMTLELNPSIKQNLLERKLLKFINSSDNNCTNSCITHESWRFCLNFRFVYFHEWNDHLWCSLFAFTLMDSLSEVSVNMVGWICWSLSSESISKQSFPFSFFIWFLL